MADDPIRLGTAALSSLIADVGSNITTDDYGAQHGTVRHFLGDQSLAQSSRFALGATYSGSLPQFTGLFVEKSGNITGSDGKTCFIDVQYGRVDPLWVNIPKRTHDLQLINVNNVDLGTGYGQLAQNFAQIIVPIPNPVLTYKYASTTYPGNLGTYGTPPQAPAVNPFVFNINSHDFTNPTLDIEQRVVTLNATLITILPDGTCTRTTYQVTATVTGAFIQSQIGTINLFNLNFIADPNGWFCLKEDVSPTASGQYYIIEQQWKRNYIFNGTTAGSWWQGGHQIKC